MEPTETALLVADRSASRLVNQRAITDMIYNTDGISKAQLAKELGISKPAISSNVADLIAIGLVSEGDEGEAAKSGGRKPTRLHFNETHSYIGALDISLQGPVCAVFDLKYNIVGYRGIKIDRKSSAGDKYNSVKEMFSGILEDRGISPDKLGIILISEPGIIDEATGAWYSDKRHHDWTEIGLKDFLHTEMNVPVCVLNDVNMAAVGELHFGLVERPKDLIYVSCGVGLGAGIVMNGELYEGSRGAAGEIASMLVGGDRRAEDAIAMDGLIGRVKQALIDGGSHEDPDKITFQYVVDKEKDGDPIVNRAIFETGAELGRVILSCSALLDIQTVIVGGEYLELERTLFDGMESVFEKTSIIRPKVFPSVLGEMAGIYGSLVIGKELIIDRLIQGERRVT